MARMGYVRFLEEFEEVCRKLHGDEDDPEFMFQDYEGFPSEWYNEGGFDDDTFDKIVEYCGMEEKEREAYTAYIECTCDDDVESFHDRYVGEYESEEDFAELILQESYIPKEAEWMLNYFDMESYARTLFMEGYTWWDGFVFRD